MNTMIRTLTPWGESKMTVRKQTWIKAIPYYGGWYTWKTGKFYGRDMHVLEKINIILPEVIYTGLVYSAVRNYLEYSSVLRNLALRMADVQAFLSTAKQMSECVAGSPALEAAYGARLTAVRQLLAEAKKDTELGRLIYYLQNLPLRNWSYFFNNAGKLLASHKIFIEHKEAFSDAMYEVGLLDSYLSFATLVQESQAYDSNHAYTFVQFLDRKQKDKPYIKLEEMWNPFLDAKVAVGNNLEMDAAPGGVRNIILTGPNAGGKSTFLTGVTHTLLY